MSILIYTPELTARIRYAFNVVLKEVCGAEEIAFTSDQDSFSAYDGVRLNYSNQEIDGAITFVPSGLLQEKDITEQEIFMATHREVPVFFSVTKSVLPFDPFAASFYLISRYEEYLPFIADAHNRYPATESLAHQHGFLQKPVVNIWGQWIAEVITEQFPNAVFTARNYNFISTVDVDNLYAFRAKGVLRTAGAILKDLSGFRIGQLIERLQVIFGLRKDPFDTFDAQMEINSSHGVESIYFMLFAEFAQFDRNISMFSPSMHAAVRGMNDYTEIGIHPSYRSNESEKIVEHELTYLEDVLRQRVTKSRQHFLKMRFPDTFRTLVDLGVKDEYSMGYASEPGFRASIATPYTFYDLEMEVAIPLTIHPFMVMDVSFIDYKNTLRDETLSEMKRMVDEVKAVNGQMISVFHNRIFSQREIDWRGWKALYQEFIAYANA